jgi:hypothetical protein
MLMRDLNVPITLPDDVRRILEACPNFTFATSAGQLYEASAPPRGSVEIAYDVPGKGRVVEAVACRVKNGISANYLEPYMRRPATRRASATASPSRSTICASRRSSGWRRRT